MSRKKYWAFISYSSADRKTGEWLHRRLEHYSIPKEFRGQKLFDGAVLGKNLRPVFLDRDELPGSSDLGAAIHAALDASCFLVVLCSRNAAKSEWVNKEIEEFRAMGKAGNILALILDGEPNAKEPSNECFPPALRHSFEPVAGDLRKEGDGKARGFLKILAGIAQLDFHRVYRRYEREQAKRRAVTASLAIVITITFAALAGVAAYQTREAKRQRVEADTQRFRAENQAEITDFYRLYMDNASILDMYVKKIDAVENPQEKAQAYAEACCYACLDGNFSRALEYMEAASSFFNGNDEYRSNLFRALIYLFNDRFEEAKAIYSKYRGQTFYDGKQWEDAVRDNFKHFRKEGHDHPDMERIEKLLGL